MIYVSYMSHMSQIQANDKHNGHWLQRTMAVSRHLPAMPGAWACMLVLCCCLPFETALELPRNCLSWPCLRRARVRHRKKTDSLLGAAGGFLVPTPGQRRRQQLAKQEGEIEAKGKGGAG